MGKITVRISTLKSHISDFDKQVQNLNENIELFFDYTNSFEGWKSTSAAIYKEKMSNDKNSYSTYEEGLSRFSKSMDNSISELEKLIASQTQGGDKLIFDSYSYDNKVKAKIEQSSRKLEEAKSTSKILKNVPSFSASIDLNLLEEEIEKAKQYLDNLVTSLDDKSTVLNNYIEQNSSLIDSIDASEIKPKDFKINAI